MVNTQPRFGVLADRDSCPRQLYTV